MKTPDEIGVSLDSAQNNTIMDLFARFELPEGITRMTRRYDDCIVIPHEVVEAMDLLKDSQTPSLAILTRLCLLEDQIENGELVRNSQIRQLERERDALLADLREADHVDCSHCKSYIHAESNDCEYADFLCDNREVKECSCRNCKDGSNWQWRGVPEVE